MTLRAKQLGSDYKLGEQIIRKDVVSVTTTTQCKGVYIAGFKKIIVTEIGIQAYSLTSGGTPELSGRISYSNTLTLEADVVSGPTTIYTNPSANDLTAAGMSFTRERGGIFTMDRNDYGVYVAASNAHVVLLQVRIVPTTVTDWDGYFYCKYVVEYV